MKSCGGLLRQNMTDNETRKQMHLRRLNKIGLVLFAGVLLWCCPASMEAASDRPPNIIFIFVDDQGYYDLGCYGATEVKTPRIDAMAKGGARFTDYYAAAPICSPSRAGLLTGCYPRRVGNEIWVHRADSRSGIHPDELTIAELLKDNGYTTACIGKWHLGFHDQFLPRNQGFDHYFGLLHNLDGVEVVYFKDKGGVPLLWNNDVVKRPVDPADLTKLYTDEAIRFIEKNKVGPFFIYLPHTMLHNPLGVSEEFKGSSNWGEYGDAIQELDHNVGRIFDSLKRMGIDDNTIVIYASDNGRGPGRTPEQKIRGGKLSTYEGGIRVPAIAWGPGLGLQAGVESSAVVRAMDWYPTLATFAGIKIPEGRVIDGRDISPLLKGETRIVPPPGMKKSLNASVPLRRRWNPRGEWASLINRNEYNDAFFYHGSQGALAAVRWRNWKLHLNPTLELYDLAKDPGESKLVRNRDITRKLRGMAVLFQEEMRLDARPAGEAPPQRRPDGRTEISHTMLDSLDAKLDVTYARYGDRTLEMDIYRPKGAWGELPAVVCIHGGGWAKGNRASHEKVAQALAARGYVAATISYRLSGEAPFPAAIQDCKAAVRFLRANAKRYGIDTANIGAIGLSAGGHLTALLATSAGARELEGEGGNARFSSAIQAAMPMGAQTDLQSQRTREISMIKDRGQIWRQFLGGAQEDKPATYRLASPLFHLDKNDPPCWYITGETDDPSTHADGFRQRMEELGIQSDLTVIKDAPHPFLGKQVWFDVMIEVADAFFTKHLKDQKSALGELGIADEGAAQLMVDSGFESLAMGNVQDTGKVQRGWEVQRHGRDSIRQALRVEVLDGDNQAKSGRRCLALSIPQNTVGFEFVTIGQRHRLEAGVEYEASVWVRWPTGPDDLPVAKRGTQTSSAIVSFWVRHRDGEGHFAGRDVWLMDNRWQQLKFRFRPTESELPSLIYLSLLPHQKPVATTLLVDDFQLAKAADSAGIDTRHEQLVLDPDFSKQDKRTISPPWYFANMNGAGIPGVVESESENRFVRMSMGEATSNFESAQLWQHVHLIEGATYEISCSMRWDNFAKDVDAPIINYGIYRDKSNTWYGPVDQVLKKTGDWQTYRFTHIPTESGPWKLYIQVNGWGNFDNGVTVSVDDVLCQQRVFSETFDNFDPTRFRTKIPSKNIEVRDGALWTRGESGGKYPPMVYLDVAGRDLEISFRYRHLQDGGWLWFFVDGDDGFGSVDHMLRVKIRRDGVQLQIDSHSLDPNHLDRQNNGRPADKVSGAYRLNKRFPQERVDFSANIWRKVKLTFQGDTVSISVDGKAWRKTLTHSCFDAAKRKLLWMQNGGEKGIEIDDILVRPSSLPK